VIRLNPFHPDRFWGLLGRACSTAKQYSEAVEAFQYSNDPGIDQHAFLAVVNAYLEEQGRAESHNIETDSGFSRWAHAASLHYKNGQDREYFLQTLLQAGLPD